MTVCCRSFEEDRHSRKTRHNYVCVFTVITEIICIFFLFQPNVLHFVSKTSISILFSFHTNMLHEDITSRLHSSWKYEHVQFYKTPPTPLWSTLYWSTPETVREELCFQAVHLFVPILWTRYLRKVLREFLQNWPRCSLRPCLHYCPYLFQWIWGSPQEPDPVQDSSKPSVD